MPRSLSRHLLGAALALAATLAAAQPVPPGGKPKDAGGKVPTAPAANTVDTSPRCQTSNVNSCRSSCESKRFEVKDSKDLGRKREACKQDCLAGC